MKIFFKIELTFFPFDNSTWNDLKSSHNVKLALVQNTIKPINFSSYTSDLFQMLVLVSYNVINHLQSIIITFDRRMETDVIYRNLKLLRL